VTRLAVVILMLMLLAARPLRADDSGSPHQSLEMCSVCHNEDMSLQRSKLETCTLCHGDAPHSGAAEHTRLEAARVDRLLAGHKDDKNSLPLTDDRRIWCGTCHLFHPASLGEDWLANGWVPPQMGLPEAVRQGVTTRWDAIAAAHDAKQVGASFADTGTRQLRLPVSDGSLCRRCHGSLP